jgi:hypothetical protein
VSSLNQYEDIIPIGPITAGNGGKIGTAYWDPASTNNRIAINTIAIRRGRLLSAPHGAIISEAGESSRFMRSLYDSISASTHHPGLIMIGRDDRPIDDLTSIIYEMNGRIRLMEHEHVDDWGLMPRSLNPDPSLYVLVSNAESLSADEASIVTSILRLGRATHVFAFLSIDSIDRVTAEDADNIGIKIFTSSSSNAVVSYLGEDIPITV